MATSSTKSSAWQIFRFLWHLPNFLKLYWRLFRDKRVPLRAKAILVAAVLYLINPFDFIPDLLFPFVGVADDIGMIILAAHWFLSLCPPEVVQERVREISGKDRP